MLYIGIGDKAELEELGIKSVLHSPQVGKNLQARKWYHRVCLWARGEGVEGRQLAFLEYSFKFEVAPNVK